MRNESPDDADRQMAIAISLAADRLDLAHEFHQHQIIEIPESRNTLAAAARNAANSGQHLKAAYLWAHVAALMPGDPAAQVAVATALMGERRGRSKKMPAILTRLEQIKSQHPDFVGAYIAYLNALRELLQFDRAEAFAIEVAPLFPNDPSFTLARVRLYEDRNAPEEALALIEPYRLERAVNPLVEAVYVRVLGRLSRFPEAESLALNAMKEYPIDRDLLSEYARLATRRGDLSEALSRWLEASTRRPTDKVIARSLQAVRFQLASQGLANAEANPKDDVLSRCESLGGTAWGCEFSMVQKRYGTGSISLFRWTTFSIDTLIDVLDHKFEGIGDEATTVLGTVRLSAEHEEYAIRDSRYGFGTHSAIKVQDAPADKALAQGRRRLRFLARKMGEDLQAAQSIYVFKIADDTPEDRMVALHGALCAYGQVALLCVLRASDPSKVGTVRQMSPGLFIGYIKRFMKDSLDEERSIDEAGWHVLCTEAEALWLAQRSKGGDMHQPRL